jgi:hypothetical protein
MKTRLNLTIEESIHERIKNYARVENVSISELVESFFKTLTSPAPKKTILDLVDQLKKPAIPESADLKELYYKEKKEKYGF